MRWNEVCVSIDNKLDVVLNVKSIQKFRGEEPYEFDFMTEGKLYRDESKLYITYHESEIMGLENQITTLEVCDGEVAMKRTGPDINTKMVFKDGYRDEGVYSTGFANLRMELLTNSLKCDINENCGNIDIKYGISIKDFTESENHLMISFK